MRMPRCIVTPQEMCSVCWNERAALVVSFHYGVPVRCIEGLANMMTYDV